jgi:hypothetical protein
MRELKREEQLRRDSRYNRRCIKIICLCWRESSSPHNLTLTSTIHQWHLLLHVILLLFYSHHRRRDLNKSSPLFSSILNLKIIWKEYISNCPLFHHSHSQIMKSHATFPHTHSHFFVIWVQSPWMRKNSTPSLQFSNTPLTAQSKFPTKLLKTLLKGCSSKRWGKMLSFLSHFL